MQEHEKIDYVEFPASALDATKEFFTKVFGWGFTDYGPEYSSFANEGINGGFFKSNKKGTTETGSALIIFYSKDLEATQKKVEEAGGKIVKTTYSFPGGRRFHFTEPSGNEFAVWSDKTD
ncbi:MAG: VOC family protein [Gracilimonas sp.]|uniref:VOC family protein n=1 Tax=Gracilimonas sp. TaxID=1974203 RepID=UPI0019BB9A8E|nr:VOC family protein [Gracilimonas sp.]MBD3617286.1 VOC family protein [Gracilimonas sp.]